MFLKTSKDMSVLVSIYSVEALFTCKKKKMYSFVQQIFTELPICPWVSGGEGWWWKTKIHKSLSTALKEFAVLKQARSIHK